MNINPDQLKLTNIFMPYAMQRLLNVTSNNTKFVHYTSAYSAMNILRSKEVWMRKTSCMNDYMEVRHGLQCLQSAYHSQVGLKFRKTLDELFSGCCNDVEKLFNGWAPNLETDTYITCVSEHDSDEDILGRLSMWRAYSSGKGVALVLNNMPFVRVSDVLKAYTSPVAYIDDRQFESLMADITQRIEGERDFLLAKGKETIVANVFHMMRFAVVCAKNPGFKEEREWRVLYTPSLESSGYLKREIESVNGVPEPVYKIPLKNIPEHDFNGIEIPELLDRVIIGPTQYGPAMFEAFATLLSEAGASEPQNRIFLSNIPLRT